MSHPRPVAASAVWHSEDHLVAAIGELETALADLRARGEGNGPVPRALSVALTNAQTAVLWLRLASTHGGQLE